MKYSRSILRGYDKVTAKVIAKQLGISTTSHKKKAMRRRLKVAGKASGGRMGAFQRRLEGNAYASDNGAKTDGKKGKIAAMQRRGKGKKDE